MAAQDVSDDQRAKQVPQSVTSRPTVCSEGGCESWLSRDRFRARGRGEERCGIARRSCLLTLSALQSKLRPVARRLWISRSAASCATAAIALAIAGSAVAGARATQITGFGAAVAVWNAHHKADHRGNLIPGCCYDPIPAHSGLVYADRYFSVNPIAGHVISYEIWTGDGTSAAAAKRVAMRELPPDARLESFTVHGSSCAILIAYSPILQKQLGHGKAGGGVVVEFSSGPAGMSFNARSVNDLLFSSVMIAGSTQQNC